VTFFKGKKYFASIIILLFTSSCIRGPHQTEETSGATDFKVLEMSGHSISSTTNEDWKIATQKNYEYKACIISRATNSPLPAGQVFNIIDPKNIQVEVKTDNLGCIIWQELIPFNFTADSVYIEKTRVLEGRGTYHGSLNLHFAVNPWLDFRGETGDEVVDLNRGNSNIPPHLLMKEAASPGVLAGLFSRESGRSLRVESPALTIIPKGYKNQSRLIKVIVRLNSFIEPLNMNNEPIKTYIERGNFKVYAQLVGNFLGDKNESLILTPEMSPQTVEIKSGGLLSFEAEVPLKRQVTSGQVQLALKIVPLNPPFDLNPYQGLHNIGEFNAILQSGTPTQIEGDISQNTFSYSSFLETTSNFIDLKNSKWAHDLPPVEYSNLEPRFVQVKPGETSTDRTIKYRVSTQVTDGITGAPIIKQPFVVTHPNGKVENIDSDATGFMYWEDELDHKYYVREHRILEKVNIKHVASQKSEVYTIALNPWDEGWTFGGDLRSKILSGDYKFANQKPNQLMIDAFRYQTIRFRYVIDEFLTLNVQKAVVMALDPLVQRDTLYRGRIFEPLRDGVYLAKIALVKYYIDPFKEGRHLIRDDKGQYAIRKVEEGGTAEQGEYTTVIKKLLRVQAGRITTPLEFSMRDIRMMSIRSNIMVELETIDEHRLMAANIIDKKISELEKEYEALHSGDLNEIQKQAYLKSLEIKMEEEKAQLENFISTELENLKQQRQDVSNRQKELSDLVFDIEHGSGKGSPKALYDEQQNAIRSVKDNDKLKRLQNARENLGQMEMTMKEHWATWSEGWEKAKDNLLGSDYSIPQEEAQRSYLDYVQIMQSFLNNSGLKSVISEEDIEKLKANNYTVNPVAPIMELDLLRNDSGLKRRTFIGPCTLVANDNMSELRATDTIDEKFCERIDCSQIIEGYLKHSKPADNSDFENSAYHDSLKPFASMNTDHAIEMHRQNEDKYIREMSALSQIGNFVEAYNLSYVSLTDEPLLQFKHNCKFKEGEECFVKNDKNVIKKDDFIQELNAEDISVGIDQYFHINPLRKLNRLNTTLISERTNELEPLSERFLRELVEFNSTYIENGVPGTFYATDLTSDAHYAGAKFIDEQESPIDTPVTASDIHNWMVTGAESLKLQDAIRICQTLTNRTIKQMLDHNLFAENSFLSGNKVDRAKTYLLESCYSKIQYMPKTKEILFKDISFDRRYKVIETGEYRQLTGKNMNINVDVGFGITSYKDISTVESIGLNKMAIAGLAAAGIFAVTVGLPVSAALAVTGLGGMLLYSGSVNDASGSNLGRNTSINAATFLVVQKAELEINLRKHEKCLTTQFSKNFAYELRLDRLFVKKGIDKKNLDLVKALTHGFLICEGDTSINNPPEKVIENYYYVTQHFTAGDMLDDVNLLNHAWLLSLRGVNDFNAFIDLLKAKTVNAQGEVITDNKLYDYPLSHLGNVYHQVLPTFPGLYTVPK
jgi:hypothetical protein